ncbi:MAG: hypothetical protein AAGK66_12135, partial [Pseudomonadota bacterium]
VHPDRMLKPAHKAGTLIAFVLDALGLLYREVATPSGTRGCAQHLARMVSGDEPSGGIGRL